MPSRISVFASPIGDDKMAARLPLQKAPAGARYRLSEVRGTAPFPDTLERAIPLRVVKRGE
jgi:hypothetical protein